MSCEHGRVVLGVVRLNSRELGDGDEGDGRGAIEWPVLNRIGQKSWTGGAGLVYDQTMTTRNWWWRA